MARNITSVPSSLEKKLDGQPELEHEANENYGKVGRNGLSTPSALESSVAPVHRKKRKVPDTKASGSTGLAHISKHDYSFPKNKTRSG